MTLLFIHVWECVGEWARASTGGSVHVDARSGSKKGVCAHMLVCIHVCTIQNQYLILGIFSFLCRPRGRMDASA